MGKPELMIAVNLDVLVCRSISFSCTFRTVFETFVIPVISLHLVMHIRHGLYDSL
jgi:hypothetical protein